ncbi:MAG: hypothetical protein ABIA75_10635 [Candidatus Neomarinimicrobiota bacterium]
MNQNPEIDNSVKRLLWEEQEYFGRLMERANNCWINSSHPFQKSLDSLLRARKNLIHTIYGTGKDYPEPAGITSDDPDQQNANSSFLTHSLIIIDANIQDLLQMLPTTGSKINYKEVGSFELYSAKD